MNTSEGQLPLPQTEMKLFFATSKLAACGVALLFSTACTSADVSRSDSSSYRSTSAQSSQANSPRSITYSKVSISDIYSLWDKNLVAAIDKYNNKPTQIAGVVNGIYNDGAGRLEVEDRNDWSGLGITCKIDSSQRAALGRLTHEGSVTIHGTLKLNNGMFDNREIEVEGCVIGAAPNIAARSQEIDDSSPLFAGVNYARKPDFSRRNYNNTGDVAVQTRQPVIPSGKAMFVSGKTGKEELIGVALSSRINSNGHTVYDAKWADGYESSYVFWSNKHAEIFSEDGAGATTRTDAKFERLTDGSLKIITDTNSVTIFPSFNPATN